MVESTISLDQFSIDPPGEKSHGGVDVILVGDSVANVKLGYENTIPVSLDEMLHHVRAVRRGNSRAPTAGGPKSSSQADNGTSVRIKPRTQRRERERFHAMTHFLSNGSPPWFGSERLFTSGIPAAAIPAGNLATRPLPTASLGIRPVGTPS